MGNAHRPFLAAGAFDFLLREAAVPGCLVQRVARRWRELNCSPEDELCLCARTGSGICASKCECLLSVHLSVHLRVLLSAIQRKIIVTEGQEVHVGSAAQRGELGLV